MTFAARASRVAFLEYSEPFWPGRRSATGSGRRKVRIVRLISYDLQVLEAARTTIWGLTAAGPLASPAAS